MLKFSKAAILIAVFSLLATSGCYTKLKLRDVNIVPDGPDEPVTETDWDFGWGWYNPNWGYDNCFHLYYNVNWWDNCRWCDEEDGAPDLETFDNVNKIPRRDDIYIPSTIINYDNNIYIPPAATVNPDIQPTAPTTPVPIVRQKSKSGFTDNSGGSNTGGNSTSKSNQKQKRRR